MEVTGHTYLVVPVESGAGFVCRIGTGREAITTTQAYVVIAAAPEVGQVLAVWRFRGEVSASRAEELAVQVAPTQLLICSNTHFRALELSHEYINEVEVVDVRPKTL